MQRQDNVVVVVVVVAVLEVRGIRGWSCVCLRWSESGLRGFLYSKLTGLGT